MRHRFLSLAVASLLVALSLLFLFYLPPLRSKIASLQGSRHKECEAAREYLISHFDPQVRLIYESEDNGSNVLEHLPELENKCFCWNTFWVYSDNLFAYHALRDHNETIAAAIKERYDWYMPKCGSSEYFEALFGDDIPDQIRDSVILFLDELDGKYVLADKHNGSTLLGGGDVSKYADACVYKALDYLWAGDRERALKWFSQAYNMFDGVGVRDATALDSNVKNRRYDTYKLALILYTSRILELEIEKFQEIEDCLWEAQHEKEGITTHVNVTTEKPEGTANAETTALALLVYEDKLIQSLVEKARWAEKLAVMKLLLIISIACALLLASWWYLLRKVRWRSALSVVSYLGQVKCLGRPLGVAILSAVNLLFALMFLTVALAPFSGGVSMGTSYEGPGEEVAALALVIFFMIGFGAIGFTLCALMSAGLWRGVNAARYFTMLIYGVAFLGAMIWLRGKGPHNLLAFVAYSPLFALETIAAASGMPLDLPIEELTIPVIVYRAAMAALSILTFYILTSPSAERHFSNRSILPRHSRERKRPAC